MAQAARKPETHPVRPDQGKAHQGAMKYVVYQASRRGGRPYNEDRVAYAYTSDALVMVLADGMGGHNQGEVASQLTVQVITGLFQSRAKPDPARHGHLSAGWHLCRPRRHQRIRHAQAHGRPAPHHLRGVRGAAGHGLLGPCGRFPPVPVQPARDAVPYPRPFRRAATGGRGSAGRIRDERAPGPQQALQLGWRLHAAGHRGGTAGQAPGRRCAVPVHGWRLAGTDSGRNALHPARLSPGTGGETHDGSRRIPRRPVWRQPVRGGHALRRGTFRCG
jgi:hypothetical protein